MKTQLPIVMNIYENPEALPKHGEYRKILNLIGQQLGYIGVDAKAKRFGPVEEFRLVEGYRRQRHVVILNADDEAIFLTHGADTHGTVYLEAYVPEDNYNYRTIMKVRRTDPRAKVIKPTSTEKDVNMQVHVKTESIREIPKTGIIVDFINALDKQAGYSDRNNQPVTFGEVAFFRAMVGFRNHKWIELVPESDDPKAIVFLTVVDEAIVETDDPRVNGAGHMVARITRSLKKEVPEPPRADLAKRMLDSKGTVGNALGAKNAKDKEVFEKRYSVEKALNTGNKVKLFCDSEEELDAVLSMYNGGVWSAIQDVLIARDNKAMVRVTLGCTQAGVQLYMRLNDHSGSTYYWFDVNRFLPMERDKIEEDLAVFDLIWQEENKEEVVPTPPQDARGSKVENLNTEVELRGNRWLEVELGVDDIDRMTRLKNMDKGWFWSELFDELHYEGILDSAVVSVHEASHDDTVAVQVVHKNHAFFYCYKNRCLKAVSSEKITHAPAEVTMDIRVIGESKRKQFGFADLGRKFKGGRNAHRPFGAGVREMTSAQDIRREHEEADAGCQSWIPQMNQFVKVEGMQGTYIITDYDDYAEMFIVRLADTCRLGRETKLSPDSASLRVPGNALRPIVLKY